MLQNTASERAVLAGLCKHGSDALIDVGPILTSDCFTVSLNQVIFKCIEHSLRDSGSTDFASILASAKTLNLNEYLDKREGLQHLEAILNTPIRLENVVGHAGTIRKLAITRELQTELRGIFDKLDDVTGGESLSEILSLAEQPIQDMSLRLAKDDDSNPQLIGASVLDYLQYVKDNQTDIVGLSSGLPEYDEAIGGGFRPGGVEVVAARFGVGKSVFCDHVALHLSRKNVPVLVLDTEMNEKDHYNRLIANLSGVDQNTIATGKFGGTDKEERVLSAGNVLSSLPFHYINIAGRSIDEIIAIVRRWVHQHVGFDENGVTNKCLVIYDYFKLNSGDDINGNMAEYQALGFQMIKLHDFMVKYQTSCLAFAQLNRQGIDKDTSDAVGGSDRIGQYATSVAFLKAKTEDEIASDGIRAGNRKLVIIKARHGAGLNGDYVCLNLDGAVARITSLGTRRSIMSGVDTSLPERPEGDGESKPYRDC